MRVALIHERIHDDAIAEQYIDGRELYVTILGNTRLQVLPIRELTFANAAEGVPRMATYKVKWDDKYRERWGINYQFAKDLPDALTERISKICKRVYRTLDMSGYGRVDLRLTADEKIYVLEANPNPGIARDEDSTHSAVKAGMNYETFIQRILDLGLRAQSTDRDLNPRPHHSQEHPNMPDSPLPKDREPRCGWCRCRPTPTPPAISSEAGSCRRSTSPAASPPCAARRRTW